MARHQSVGLQFMEVKMLRGTIVLVVSILAANVSAMQWQEEPHFIGQWQVLFGTSELDDSEGVLAVIWDDWRGHNSSNWSMYVVCSEGRPFVEFSVTDEGEFINDAVIPVAYRLDKNPVKRQDWIGLVDGSGALIEHEQAREFLSDLITADELFIRAPAPEFP